MKRKDPPEVADMFDNGHEELIVDGLLLVAPDSGGATAEADGAAVDTVKDGEHVG